ncbi:MAG TPA: hypothetical protein VGD98_09765 [Ktedonobacteraceae bacterium]
MVNEQRFALSQQQKPQAKRLSFLGWWYRLSTPDEALEFAQGTILPRSRLASILLLIILIAILAFIPAALTSDGMHVLPPLAGMFVMTCVAIFFNRLGKVTLAGILIVVAFDAALAESLLSYPNFVLTQNAVPIYDMFVLADIIAISLLPIRSIFFVSSFHSVFMLADIMLQPHTPDLQLLIDQTTYSFMVRPLAIQIVVALVTFLWVRNTMKALERANKAEIIAQLEHTLSIERQDLAEGLQQILYTLVEAANGNLSVRAPLAQQHALWQVGVGLNILLARLQRSSQSEREFHHLQMEIQRLLLCLQESKSQRALFWLSPGGTELDLLISELLNINFSQPPPKRR